MKLPKWVLPFVAWFLVGATVAVTVQTLRAGAVGGPAGLLFAGELEPAHELVQVHLPEAPVVQGYGHDGQIFFAIGTDPSMSEASPSTVPPQRYRRILYPAVASGFGLLGGDGLLWGLISVAALSVGLAAGAVGAIGTRWSLPFLAPLAVVLNPGVLISSALLTADAFALALGLLGVWAYSANRDRWAIVAFAAAALTRETHLVFPLALAGYLWFRGATHRSMRFALIPPLALAGWLFMVELRLGNALAPGDNLTFPFSGILQSVEVWRAVNSVELVLTGLTIFSVVLAINTVLRHRNLGSWLVGPWIGIALIASHYVWDLGNNSIRTLAPLFTLGAIGPWLSETES